MFYAQLSSCCFRGKQKGSYAASHNSKAVGLILIEFSPGSGLLFAIYASKVSFHEVEIRGNNSERFKNITLCVHFLTSIMYLVPNVAQRRLLGRKFQYSHMFSLYYILNIIISGTSF
jgi:hypothetical protein